MSSYVIISPVRNEEDYVRLTLDSVAAQSKLPAEWIIVNDGSTDGTAGIVEEFAQRLPWIKLINLTDRGYYFPGTGVVNVFNQGYAAISAKDWDYVVKLDADISFAPDYFENLLQRFAANSRLGIASGITYLPKDGAWIREDVLPDHPVGPSKVYKRQCWEVMGGLKPVPGWDLADLLGAQMNGWETACFDDLIVKHYRLTGSRRKGAWARNFLQGRFEYQHGYAFHYTCLKALYHVLSKPVIIGSLAKICGYLYARINGDEFLFEDDMRAFLRQKHKAVLKKKLGFSGS
jgi:glycosyltransferase involved in cell wall biosynthesis